MEALLDSEAIGLVISSEFTRKQGFKLKRIERPIYVRNVDRTLNKEGLIEHTVEVNVTIDTSWMQHGYGSRV